MYVCSALAETEHRYHASDCTECQQVIQGYENVAKHMQRESTILENQVRWWCVYAMMMMLNVSITHIYKVNAAADGVLENLKNFRDLLVAYRVGSELWWWDVLWSLTSLDVYHRNSMNEGKSWQLHKSIPWQNEYLQIVPKWIKIKVSLV